MSGLGIGDIDLTQKEPMVTVINEILKDKKDISNADITLCRYVSHSTRCEWVWRKVEIDSQSDFVYLCRQVELSFCVMIHEVTSHMQNLFQVRSWHHY